MDRNFVINAKRFIALVAVSFGLMGCQSTTTPVDADQPVLSVPFIGPMQHDFRRELKIAQVNQALTNPDISIEQRAVLHHQRGALYDSVGLSTLARLDFNYALKLKPDFGQVYNYIGIYYTLNAQYEDAYESFDAVIELLPEHEYVYLNRGIALYYGDRPDLAENDLKQFLALDPSDPYRALWVYLATVDIDPALAQAELVQHAQDLDQSRWSYQLVQFFMGEIDEFQLLFNMQNDLTTPTEYHERLCEAYFYLAKMALINNKPLEAEDYFLLSRATNVYEFVEYKYSELELRKLYSKQQEVETQSQ